MHSSVMQFVRLLVEAEELSGCDVLEVGSLDVNGSVRQLFNGNYHGIDIQDGPGVDQVLDAHSLSMYYRDAFDVVVSTEMLEHDTRPWQSLLAMNIAARPGGWLILTCRGFDERGAFPLHEYPWDMYRFSVEAICELLRWAGWQVLSCERDPEVPGVFAYARKGRVPA